MAGVADADDAAPGWDAITAALDRLYPGVEPHHVGTLIKWRLGGPDPIDGISVWRREDPVPHWHYVTYGLSELYAKEWDDPAISGFGLELTFRLRCAPGDTEPPAWVYGLVQNLARYVFQTGNVLRVGDWMPANGPIALEHDTALVSLGFVADPELPAIETPNGGLAFVQVVGLTQAEERAAKHWNTRGLLDAMLPAMPLWVTDLSRDDLSSLPAVKARADEGERQDGSSTGMLGTDVLDVTTRKRLLRAPERTVVLSAGVVEELMALLPLRLPFGRPLRVVGEGRTLMFEAADADEVAETEAGLRLALSTATLERLVATVPPRAGSYAVPGLPGLTWDVRRTAG